MLMTSYACVQLFIILNDHLYVPTKDETKNNKQLKCCVVMDLLRSIYRNIYLSLSIKYGCPYVAIFNEDIFIFNENYFHMQRNKFHMQRQLFSYATTIILICNGNFYVQRKIFLFNEYYFHIQRKPFHIQRL